MKKQITSWACTAQLFGILIQFSLTFDYFCLFALLYSPNVICYKIGEKICDQFNNGFILMVSEYVFDL